jgi:hypothetical protein
MTDAERHRTLAERVARLLDPEAFKVPQTDPYADLDRDNALELAKQVVGEVLATVEPAVPTGAEREALEDERSDIGCALAVLRLAAKPPEEFAVERNYDPQSYDECVIAGIAYLVRRAAEVRAALQAQEPTDGRTDAR